MLDVLAQLDRDGWAGDIEDCDARNQALLGGGILRLRWIRWTHGEGVLVLSFQF